MNTLRPLACLLLAAMPAVVARPAAAQVRSGTRYVVRLEHIEVTEEKPDGSPWDSAESESAAFSLLTTSFAASGAGPEIRVSLGTVNSASTRESTKLKRKIQARLGMLKQQHQVQMIRWRQEMARQRLSTFFLEDDQSRDQWNALVTTDAPLHDLLDQSRAAKARHLFHSGIVKDTAVVRFNTDTVSVQLGDLVEINVIDADGPVYNDKITENDFTTPDFFARFDRERLRLQVNDDRLHDAVGATQLRITRDLLEQGETVLSFGSVYRLRLTLQPARPAARGN